MCYQAGWYEAFKSKDARFDGKFFIGVKTTKIYCRPVCKAKLPQKDNCTFYLSAAQAERDGFRPCLICRPELAPKNNFISNSNVLIQQATTFINENASYGINISDIANYLGCSNRHVRRVFKDELNITPLQYLQTTRLLLAKTLLSDTNLSMLDVAMVSGFTSLRSFNNTFKQKYNLIPSSIRKNKEQKNSGNTISIALSYRPPYLWDNMLNFLELRAIPNVEKIEDNKYYRSVVIKKNNEIIRGWLIISNDEQNNKLIVKLESTLLPVLPYIILRVKNLFDLDAQPDLIYDKLSIMNEYKANLCQRGTRIPGSFDPFEMAIRAILGQQISVKAARTLAARIVEKFGYEIETGIEGITHCFPLPEDIINLGDNIEEHLGLLGIIKRRSRTILALAYSFENEDINFYNPINPEEEIKKLVKLPGIGDWTANYIALRAMGWVDAFLSSDLGVIKALAPLNNKEIVELANEWRPWRGYAMINLWHYDIENRGDVK